MKQYGVFIKAFFIGLLLCMGIVGGVNYYIDPLWCFPERKNQFNKFQVVTAEQQQKTNKFYYGAEEYDTLILGSSGVSFINQADLKGNAYNYASPGMWPGRYQEYVDFVRAKQGRPLKCIVIGIEFIETDYTSFSGRDDKNIDYIANTLATMYRWSSLFKVDTFKCAIENIRLSLKGVNAWKYDRNNVHYGKKSVSACELNKKVLLGVKGYTSKYKAYKYDESYKKYLVQLKANNPDTEFIVFTFPTSAPMINAWKENNLWDAYERWLRDTTEVFGEVHHMAWNNSFTTDWENYMDGNHIHSTAANKVVYALTHSNEVDYNLVLTRDNIDETMPKIKKNIFQDINNYFD